MYDGGVVALLSVIAFVAGLAIGAWLLMGPERDSSSGPTKGGS